MSGVALVALAVHHNIVANGLAGFPTGPNDDFVVLSTGDALKAYAPRGKYPAAGLDVSPKGSAGDSQHLRVTVPVAAGQTHLKFDFDFLTDEAPGGSGNDEFLAQATPVGVAGTTDTLTDLHVNDAPLLTDPSSTTGFVAPQNAIYTRHTGAMTADYPIPAGATAVVLDLTVSDAGTGTGDTAVALDNFRATTGTQTVWLNFDGGTLNDFPVLGGVTTFPAFDPADVRSAIPRTTLIDTILADVQNKFTDFDINFTLTQPASGPYTEIPIGGTGANPISLGSTADPLQAAELGSNTTIADALGGEVFGYSATDFGNPVDSSPGFVLSGEFNASALYSGEDETTLVPRLEVTIAHEVAHTLGTPHVDDSFDSNIMAEFAPRSPFATFEDAEETLPAPLPDGHLSLNVHDYLQAVLGGSAGASAGNSAGQSQLKLIMSFDLPVDVYNVAFGLVDGTAADTAPGGRDDAILWQTFPQLKKGPVQLVLPNLGPKTQITFFASTAPGGYPFVYSGAAVNGNLSFADSFINLFDPFTGLPNQNLQISFGTPGNLQPYPKFLALSFSPFADPGLTGVDPKKGYSFFDPYGNLVTVTLKSKTGKAAVDYDPTLGEITRIDLQGTTAKDTLTIKVKADPHSTAGFPYVRVKDISGPALGTLNAGPADIAGDGVISFGDAVKSILVHDVYAGAQFQIGGDFDTSTSLTAHVI